ncbi:tRNA-uridine aminocarboxypropyltransferase [Oceanicoccus sp. KOV_DT_Chl]|uniref:tRNA-uridine aminocarboxypropyltransferase n=1 Tax=Oceanicoccus sp. KOV_DT_Chl TaxID=1904639 RepID=UPI00135909FA|nr:tRNA-uridine aminocarboxypropyltransferase [Oceanicoccus sp. KOV_DT_Chl]
MPRPQCDNCLRPLTVCYCHTLTTINNQWPVTIVQHPSESRHAIGTARIAELSLLHCQLLNSDNDQDQRQLKHIMQQQPLLIYPGEDSTPLASIDNTTIRPLLFIDASWRKSRRMLFENPQLAALPKVQLTPTSRSRYQIRKQPDAQAIATVEAIAQTLGFLERNSTKYAPLLASMEWIIAQQIKAMGTDVFIRHYRNKN